MNIAESSTRTPTFRLGIIGGSFDPVHKGHIALAKACLHSGRIDRALLIPAARAPLRVAPRESARHRMAMCKLAIAGVKNLTVCGLEAGLQRAYTVDTLAQLTKLNPGCELFLIIGTDLVGELTNWRNLPGILKLAQIMAVRRPGWLADTCPPDPALADRLQIVDVDTPDISSTLVRANLAAGAKICNLVPAPVLQYIRSHNLYQHA